VHKRTKGKWAPKSCRQSLAAAKHFYRGMLGLELSFLDLIKARDRETLPTVLTVDELRRLFAHVRFNRYRVPLLLIYACGLRVNECTHLMVDYIDGAGNRLFIRDGKGGKDRYTILSTVVYHLLQDYWKQLPSRWIVTWAWVAAFRGCSGGSHYPN
jgi:integrase